MMTSSLRHPCLIHEGSLEIHLGVIAPFLAQGLKERGRALFMGSPTMAAELRSSLSAGGVKVDDHRRAGSLLLITDQDHLTQGQFDPALNLARIEDFYRQAMIEDYTGLWGVGDIAWEFGPQENLMHLVEYEYGVDALVKKLPQLHALCQYHKDILPLQSVGSALLTHRGVFMQDRRQRDNPFFTPAEPALSPFPNESQIERMLNIIAVR